MSESWDTSVLNQGAHTQRGTVLSDPELAKLVGWPATSAVAFHELYTRHAADLLAMLTARFASTAEDAAQEAWLKVHDLLCNGTPRITSFRGWLWTIARNVALDELRKKRPVGLEAVGEPDDGEKTPLEEQMHLEREQAMRDCLTLLHATNPQQAMVIAAFSDGEAVMSAAQRLEITCDNFYTRKQRALLALRVCGEGKLS